MTFHLEPERHKDYESERDKLRVQENGSLDSFKPVMDRKSIENRPEMDREWTEKINRGRSEDPSKGVRKQDKIIFYSKGCLGDFLFDKERIHFYSQVQKSHKCG